VHYLFLVPTVGNYAYPETFRILYIAWKLFIDGLMDLTMYLGMFHLCLTNETFFLCPIQTYGQSKNIIQFSLLSLEEKDQIHCLWFSDWVVVQVSCSCFWIFSGPEESIILFLQVEEQQLTWILACCLLVNQTHARVTSQNPKRTGEPFTEFFSIPFVEEWLKHQ
jgi:hypothetical protein